MEKRNCKKIIIFIIIGILFSPTLFASDEMSTSVSILGTVVVPSCSFSKPKSLFISLGKKIPASMLNGVTPYSDWIPFTINLIKCETLMHTVTVTFSGTPDNRHKEMYANRKGGIYAANVAVELQQASDGKNLGNGKSLTSPVISSGNVSFALRARAYGTGRVTSGQINSTVLMSLTYN